MKLSEIKGEHTIDVIAAIIEPVAEIASDPVAAEMFSRKALPEGEDPKKYAVKRIRKSVPALLKNHKKELIAILAALEGISEEEYAEKLNMVTLVHDLLELLNDKDFIALFT